MLVAIFGNLIATESASVDGAESDRHRDLWIKSAYNGGREAVISIYLQADTGYLR